MEINKDSYYKTFISPLLLSFSSDNNFLLQRANLVVLSQLPEHLSISNLCFNEQELCLHLLDIITIKVCINDNTM